MDAKMKIRKSDTVEVITGKDKGARGEVVKVLIKDRRVIVRGVNMVSKAKRRRNQQEKGEIIRLEAPIDVSNVMIICKKCGKTRIGYTIKGDKKVRVCKKCGEAL